MKTAETKYGKENPFLATMTKRYNLCKNGSEKNVHHVELDLSGSDMTYKVGDSIAIHPTNDPDVVEKTLKALGASGTEMVSDKQGLTTHLLRDYLERKCNLATISRKLVTEIASRQQQREKQERLLFLLQEDQKEAFKEYQESHEVWDALQENEEAVFSPQELCHLLMPQLPRFYSIASSMLACPESAHLTVAELVYETNGHTRRGACTHYLSQLVPLNEAVIPVYMHPSKEFTIPVDDKAPMIMIGPGTGIAPFRGFMQERIARGATGQHWLFFGEWHRQQQFFYEEYWQSLVEAGQLNMVTAFSRDQEHKIYVQHRILEHGQVLFDLLEQGGYFYVCGDAQKMAKDVDAALHQLVQSYGRCEEAAAKDYVKKMKSEKRYLRDVY